MYLTLRSLLINTTYRHTSSRFYQRRTNFTLAARSIAQIHLLHLPIQSSVTHYLFDPRRLILAHGCRNLPQGDHMLSRSLNIAVVALLRLAALEEGPNDCKDNDSQEGGGCGADCDGKAGVVTSSLQGSV